MKSTLLFLLFHMVSALRMNTGSSAQCRKNAISSFLQSTNPAVTTKTHLSMSTVGGDDENKSELFGIGGDDGSTSGDELPDDAFGAPVGPLPTVSSNINMGEMVIDENNLGK